MAAEPRIVCLVPSVTELVCDLGLAPRLVGRTGFCIHPWETVRTIPKVGGTKDVKLERVRELRPTHVIVNVDENRREDAEAIAEFAEVVVTDPRQPRDNLELYRLIGGTFGKEGEAAALCERFEAAFERAAAGERRPSDVLYLIWRDPWMTVGPDTYVSKTLALFGWRTLPFAACQPEGDKGRTVRYPEVDLEVVGAQADRILLSSEPFHFKDEHVAEISALAGGTPVALIDGEMTSWYGSRAIAGLEYLAEYTEAAA